jgi:sugar phosphate permease
MSRRWCIFAISTSLFFLSQFYRASNAVIAPHLLQDLSLDTRGLGLISSSFFYAFALTQIPISIYLDRVGPRRMMTALSLVGVVGAFIFAWADSLTMGLAGRALLGMGMACNLMGTYKLLTVWFGPLSFATLSGVVFSIGTAGNMVATTPLVLLVQKMGWRLTFCLIGGINLLMILVLYVVVLDRPPEKASISSSSDSLSGGGVQLGLQGLHLLLRMRDYWIISLGAFVRYGVFASFQTLWAGPYLMESMGLSALKAGNLIFLMNVGMILGGPVWGGLSDRVFKTRKWIIFSGLMILSFVMLLMTMLSPGTGLVVLSLLFFGFGLFAATGILVYPHIKELMPLEMSGTSMTAVNFFNMIGPAVFLQGLGTLMQSLYPQASRGPDAFNAAFLVCTAWLVAASLLYLLTRDKMGQGE